MLTLWNVPSTKEPINVTTAISYVIPPVVCYFAVALLSLRPQTHAVRIALWPLVCLLALRAAVSVEMPLDAPGRKVCNTTLVFYMFMITIRTLDWTLEKGPLVPHLRPTNNALTDVLHLASSLRGHGWNWSRGVYIPQETRPTGRVPFVFHALRSALVHTSVWGVSHKVALSFPGVVSTASIPTIIDDTLPFAARYLRAGVITLFTGITGYASLQAGYDLCAISALLFLGQDPVQWPPAFESPWCATSLHDFWGRRWHQWNRHVLVLLGGYPLAIFLGRVGLVLGTFLASAVMHDIVLLGIDDRIEFSWMLVGFGMMGPGMLAERAFYKLTRTRVDGFAGWAWTMTWLLLFGGVMAEGCARAGGLGTASFIDDIVPLRVLIERLVARVDTWLRLL